MGTAPPHRAIKIHREGHCCSQLNSSVMWPHCAACSHVAFLAYRWAENVSSSNATNVGESAGRMRYLVRADRCDAELENWTVVPSILAGLVSRYRRNHCRTR